MSGKDRGRGVTHTSKKSLKGLTADECVLYSIMLKATKNGLKHWHKIRVCMRAVQRAVGRSVGRTRGRTTGRGRWFAGFHRFTLEPKSVDSRRPPALRPSVDHIASIGDFGWDGMMAWRGREEQKTAWHAMPREGGRRGPRGR